MMNKINQFITLALGSGLSILLSPRTAYPADINPRIQEKNHGVCISIVDILSDQITVKSLTILPDYSLITENKIRINHHQETSIDRRGSERHP